MKTKRFSYYFLFVLFISFILRIIIAACSSGFETDIACFAGWATRVQETGLSGFYSKEVFTDYPPGYIYLLYGIGFLLKCFSIDAYSPLGLILLKAPSILCDLILGLLIYLYGKEHFSEKNIVLLSSLYLFHPAVLMNSALWGQIDSILTLFLLLTILLLQEKRLVCSFFLFGMGLLIKPQILIFTPLLLLGIYEYKILPFRSPKALLSTLFGGIAALLFVIATIIPFGFHQVISQYTDTLSSYPYASVNAYNIWALLGQNWDSQDLLFCGIPYRVIGSCFIILITVISFILFVFLRKYHYKERYFLTGAFLIISTFLCSVRMHERYLYPAMALLLFCYLAGKRISTLRTFIFLSICHALNIWHVLYRYEPYHYYEKEWEVILLSFLLCLSAAYFYGTLFQKASSPYTGKFSLCARPHPSRKPINITKQDIFLLCVIVIPYAILTFMNLDYISDAYFDEIYYFRTASEFLDGLPAYENTHPPLGKIFIALGTFLFGRNPFGFRFMGAFLGVLMLPILYFLARNLTRSRTIGFLCGILFAYDFMHYTQTRIATIDVFAVFFIILMYYFMERYITASFYDTNLKHTLIPLGFCGISFGLGVASKWTVLYAGLGLAVLFFASLVQRYLEYRYALNHPNGTTNLISHAHIIRCFLPHTIKTLAFYVLFFVCIPFLIYTLSYIPFKDYTQDGLLERMWNNQLAMFHYHSSLTATHPYASPWYQWPFMIRPVFYYANTHSEGLYQGISAFGNPFVWYPAIPAVLYTLYQAIKKHHPTACFLCIGFFSGYLPWIFVDRCTFLYHYFPCVPFLVLILGFTIHSLFGRLSHKKFQSICILYGVLTIAVFILFYPVISGVPVTADYVDTFLRWMDSWVFILP